MRLALLVLLLSNRTLLAQNIITTIAGTGSASFSGDGGSALLASMASPSAIEYDAGGNLYVADLWNHRIRRVDAVTGVITTIAGNGSNAFGGDGVLATSTGLYYPQALALDSVGTVHLAEVYGNRVSRILSGRIYTVAGNGTPGFSGDGGPAISALVNGTVGAAFDSAGNLYVADSNNHRVRRIDKLTGLISTVAGSGTAGFGGDGGSALAAALYPVSVAFDVAGNLYITDRGNHRIRRVAAATGIITTLTGTGVATFSGDGGPAASASIAHPNGLLTDSAGNIYFADQGNHRIRKVDAATGTISTVAGSGVIGFGGDGGPALNARFNNPSNLAWDLAGNLVIADAGNHRIRRVAIANTLPGSGGTTLPVDSTTGTAPVSLTFNNVVQGGTTSLTTAPVGPPPPSGFRLGTPPVYYNLSTTAVFSGPVTVCFNYTGVSFGNENRLELLHHNGTQWEPITTSRDTVANVICGLTTSLSPFAVLEGEGQPPVVLNVVTSPNPVPIGTAFQLTALVSDTTSGASNVVAAEYSVNNGAPAAMAATDGSFDQPSENVQAAVPAILQQNLYTICARGRDAAGNWSENACIPVPVYDPSGGFATGGGQVEAPMGSDLYTPLAAGPAVFGFVSKYSPGANTPKGNLEFQFKSGNLNFKSTALDWLVVTGEPRARFQGEGILNGSTSCKFEVDAWDNSHGPEKADAFGVRIFSCGAGADRFRLSPTALARGSVVIHKE